MSNILKKGQISYSIKKQMADIRQIYDAIAHDGFAATTLMLIDSYVNDIQNGRTDFPRFTQAEHAGLCTAGAPLIGASVVASYAAASLGAGSDAAGGEGSIPNRWEVDRLVLEDMHPANVFIDDVAKEVTCIDCIVKFKNRD